MCRHGGDVLPTSFQVDVAIDATFERTLGRPRRRSGGGSDDNGGDETERDELVRNAGARPSDGRLQTTDLQVCRVCVVW